MLFPNEKKVLFDNAYESYLAVINSIEDLYDGTYSERIKLSLMDLICEFNLFIHFSLLSIGFTDGIIDEMENEFIFSLIDEIDELCNRNKGYRRFIKNITIEKYNEEKSLFFDGISYEFLKEINKFSKKMSIDTISSIEKIFKNFIRFDDIASEKEVEEASRIINNLKDIVGIADKDISKANEDLGIVKKSVEYGFSEAIEELNSLIGLKSVKNDVNAVINLIRVNNIRKQKNMPLLQTSNHMVFIGQPGTGKTTVARILATVYKELGVVSKGCFHETDRSGLVAGYVGQTALKTLDAIEKAKGGVLFIDEAYSLSSSEGQNDFGKEAIDTLVKAMEDYRDDLVVIVAGYPKEMERFINMNPGLKSRFNKYILFENYNTEEMMEILKKLCTEKQFILSDEAEQVCIRYFASKCGDNEFGNARGVRNYFDKIVLNYASRIIEDENLTDTELQMINEEDCIRAS